jgi:hypothetical protein
VDDLVPAPGQPTRRTSRTATTMIRYQTSAASP